MARPFAVGENGKTSFRPGRVQLARQLLAVLNIQSTDQLIEF
jgi:hypothetical protein